MAVPVARGLDIRDGVHGPHSQIRSGHRVQGTGGQLRHIAEDDGGAEQRQALYAVLVGGLGSFVLAEDGGGDALPDLVGVGCGARAGIVPAAVVGSFDGLDGVGVREDGEDEVGRDGVERVVCGRHCGQLERVGWRGR